jgi:hypothetical protein
MQNSNKKIDPQMRQHLRVEVSGENAHADNDSAISTENKPRVIRGGELGARVYSIGGLADRLRALRGQEVMA